jgi:hypothetical protein
MARTVVGGKLRRITQDWQKLPVPRDQGFFAEIPDLIDSKE